MFDESAIRRQVAAGLRRARVRSGQTQEHVAERLDMSTSGLRHLEAARHSVRVEQLPALARALSTTVHALLVDMRLVRRARKTPPARQGALVGGSLEGDGSTAATGMGHRPRSGYQQDPDRETPRDAEGDGDPA